MRKIMKKNKPAEQKKLGREIKNFKQREWDKIKLQVVNIGSYLT